MSRSIKSAIPLAVKRKMIDIKNSIFDGYSVKSYAQEGEDLVLARILDNMKVEKGFFVDVGAHHPTRFSNTYYFYRRGWRGINVDALPGTQSLFKRARPRDITLECGVGARPGILKYFAFNEPALNTFSEQEASRKNITPYHIIDTHQIAVVTLKKILDDNLPRGVSIDFLTIDVEGLDHEVISSNDWSVYRPKVILVELLNTGIENIDSNVSAQILRENNYRLFAKTYNTYFFVANEVI